MVLPAGRSRQRQSNGSASKVLLAEDNATSRRMLERTLEKWGFEVVSTSNGLEAWEVLCGDAAPGIAILDWMMPEMDGPEVCRRLRENPRTASTYVLLLTARSDKDDIVMGFKAGADDYVAKPFNRDELQARLNVGRRIVELQYELADRVRELEALNQKLESLSSLDGLTSIPNRRFFDSQLEKEWRRSRRVKRPLSLVMLDIDYFKRYNDKCGHLAGDECLKRVAKALQDVCKRAGDFVFRYGGEEFAALLTATSTGGAQMVAETLRRTVEELRIPHPASETSAHVSISLGVASLFPDQEDSSRRLIEMADEALYKAKAQGRNRVAFHEGSAVGDS